MNSGSVYTKINRKRIDLFVRAWLPCKVYHIISYSYLSLSLPMPPPLPLPTFLFSSICFVFAFTSLYSSIVISYAFEENLVWLARMVDRPERCIFSAYSLLLILFLLNCLLSRFHVLFSSLDSLVLYLSFHPVPRARRQTLRLGLLSILIIPLRSSQC